MDVGVVGETTRLASIWLLTVYFITSVRHSVPSSEGLPKVVRTHPTRHDHVTNRARHTTPDTTPPIHAVTMLDIYVPSPSAEFWC